MCSSPGGRGQPHPPKLRAITLDSKERIGQLVDSYEFDRIVYFSEYLTPHSEQEGELDRLRRVLQANRDPGKASCSIWRGRRRC